MSRTVFWNNDEPTQIAYELKVEDFTQAYTPHRKTKTWWLVFRILLSIGALFVAVVLFGFLLKPSWPMAKALIPLLLLVPMWIAVLCLLPWWSMRRQFPQQPGAHGPRSLTLDDGGMHCRWNGGSSDIEWKNYIGSVEGKNQILSSPPQQLQHPSQTPFRRSNSTSSAQCSSKTSVWSTNRRAGWPTTLSQQNAKGRGNRSVLES